jgi:uncharacterized membrane protein
MFAGALIRQFFVQRHGYHLGRAKNPLPFAVVGVLLLLSVIVALKPAAQPETAASKAPVGFAQVQGVLAQRCILCHGEATQMKGIRFDQIEGIKANAQGIYQQAVVTRQMPLNNATQITEDERQLIKRWFEGGAPL